MFNVAMAQEAAGAAKASPLTSFIPFILIFFVMYFLMIRPQKKKLEKEQGFLKGLKKGDEIFTKSGMLGTVAGITDSIVSLEVADNIKIKVLKSQVAGSSTELLTKKETSKK